MSYKEDNQTNYRRIMKDHEQENLDLKQIAIKLQNEIDKYPHELILVISEECVFFLGFLDSSKKLKIDEIHQACWLPTNKYIGRPCIDGLKINQMIRYAGEIIVPIKHFSSDSINYQIKVGNKAVTDFFYSQGGVYLELFRQTLHALNRLRLGS